MGMNEVLATISRRRSIRHFKDEQVKRQDLDAIVEAGLCAPSANNVQNSHFTVIQDKATLEKTNAWVLDEIEKSGNAGLQELVRKGAGIFRNAPTVIIVSTDRKDRFAVINAAAATENMLIAAESLGIASCWIGMVSILSGSTKSDFYTKELHLPDGYTPQIGITLGYKDASPPPAPKRRENLVSYIL
jgi:nitroreductase